MPRLLLSTVSHARLTARLVPFATVAFCLGAAARDREASREGEALFESRVRPLLVAKCQECHGEKVAEAGLRLDSRKGLLLGSDAGAVVVPGDAAKTTLLAAVKHVDDLAMPPDAKLSKEEIAALEEWVSVGVPWTGPGGEDGGPATRDEAMQVRIRESRGSHWAFRPPERHDPPQLAADGVISADVAAAWSRSSIDRFIVADPSEDAYRAVVERLLASREHAEHWARQWLDLARYADTMGYAFPEQSRLYPFAWT